MVINRLRFLQSEETWRSPAMAVACGVMLLLAVAAIGYRVYSKYQTPGPFDSQRQGFCDFHNGIYFPAVAFRSGISPYGQPYADQFPVARPIPFFAPLVMVLHWPYTWLTLPAADFIHFAVLIVQVLFLGWLTAKFGGLPETPGAVLGATLLIVVSRGGYATLFTGYFTFLMVIGTIVVFQYSHRPSIAGPALLLACLKPTYAIPLFILLAARRQWRTVAFGFALVVVANLLAAGWLLQFNSAEQLVADVRLAQGLHLDDPNEMPVNTWTRVDLMAVIAKWLNWNPGEAVYLAAMVPLLMLPVMALWRLSAAGQPGTAADLSGLIAGLAMLVTIYHHYYDATLLAPAVVGLWTGAAPSIRAIPAARRWILFSLLLFVLMNYASAQFVMERFDLSDMAFQIITSVNGVLLALALGLALWEGLIRQPPSHRVNLET